MNRIRFIELLCKKESGQITLLEQKELNGIIAENEIYSQIDDSIGIFSSHTSNFNSKEQEFTEHELAKLNLRLKKAEAPPTFFGHFKKSWIAAASLIILVSSGIFLYQFNKSAKSKKENIFSSVSIIDTKKGSKSSLVLPDGTKVWVNAETRLSYNKNFGEKTREVTLEGEAYFDVVKNKDIPFIVHTDVMDVKVLGTAFNVRAYKDEITTQATLIRGLIEVALKKKNNEKILLKPSEKITVRNNYSQFNDSLFLDRPVGMPEISLIKVPFNITDSTTTETQWVKNRLVFDQMKLDDIVTELERWYGVEIKVKDTAISIRRISGIYENESLEQVLESFRLAAGVKYEIKGKHVTLY